MVMTQNWKEALTFHVGKSEHPLIVVLGPTASGKTNFSLNIAHAVAETRGSPLQNDDGRSEILNADSRQLYRFMDIGTAKIHPEEMRGIPHHLLDVLDPKEEATAAWYKTEVTRVIGEILGRGNVPILVGGSMLYISALLDDLQFVANADPALRKKLEEQYDADRGAALFKRLQRIDPETASAFSVKNKSYVIRAMEILEGTGMKPSEAKQSGTCPWDLLIFGMQWQRETLVERINARTKEMFEDGWIEEVQSLLDRGYSIDDPGMKSHGYREIAEAISSGELNTNALQEIIAAKARQYAKRQMTWWKGDPRIQWLDVSALN
ncbi:MAG: tRNA dimethylallyltransferase [Candidatus Peregrinibacteria bacterium Greene0416_62]|nr:MAG: tRNA dimethylallyltransferase [Candidatus Peregrinibacteria bacterium Greene0416_62]TSC98126.1 MAG: tRNA dimethylallyltransferase [Candidatus Peregrinibacteria bacterium Greene1014_49]